MLSPILSLGIFQTDTDLLGEEDILFMYFSAVPVSLSFFLLWDPPEALTQSQLFFYLLGVGVFIRTAITFYEIPSTALGPELSKDYVERSSLLSYRYWFGWWGGLLVWNFSLDIRCL